MCKAIPHFAKKRVESDHVGKRKTINLKQPESKPQEGKYDTTHLMSVSDVQSASSLQGARLHDHMHCRLIRHIIGLRTCM